MRDPAAADRQPAARAHRVVIIGGGFGGLYAAQALARAPVQVTLLDRRNFHLFQPLLYQVATGGLSPGEIASPLRSVLKRQRNTEVWLAEVTSIDVAGRRVLLSDGEVPYDSLIVATGARHHYFGNSQWEPLAPGLKGIEDATEIRRRVLLAFEIAEREPDAARRRAWLTFVIVGAGPTGVELAGALGEIANHTLKRDFRTINPSDAQILLLENAERVLPPYSPKLAASASAALQRLGVTVRTGVLVTNIEPEAVTLRRGDSTERIPTHTVLWAAGVQASPLGKALADGAGAPLDRVGRVMVEPDLTVPGHPEIIVIGDLASFSHQDGKPLPGVAPVAMQQGRYAARLITQRLGGGGSLPAFHYVDRGSMATIGRGAAVAHIGPFEFGGYLAWLSWLFIHLMYLVEFDNRLLVFVQWAWNYISWNRGARLITGESSCGKILR
ncbi:MAG: NAD(P)/FAD-dependent oxidoreductase [Deltaproteobacteria bacterium]|nr:NAD(P)/FAD-dependent oxidoreductase [Deltaproteobacteria bacterium]